MARHSLIETLLAPRFAALLDVLPSSLQGDQPAVHQARVASRRIREVLPVFTDVLGDDALARARKATRRVTRALGPVRELDVAAALFHEFALAHEAGPAAVVSVTRDLARARSSALRRARLKLTPSRLAKLRASLEALDVALPPGAALVVSRALDARIARRAQGLQRALHRAGTLYVPARLHAVRIAVKQLRYATEVAGALHRARVSSRLAQLRALQDLLGRAHDVHVLGERLRQVQTRVVRTSRSTAREVGRLARLLEQVCRELHASFMSRRSALVALCDALGPRPQSTRAARVA